MRETLQLSWLVAMRHFAIYRKDFLANISPTLMDPAFYILALGFGLGSYVNELKGMSYVKFMAPGLTITTALFTAFFESSYGLFVRLNFEGIYKAMMTSPIGFREIILGEFIWLALKGFGMSLAVTLVLLSMRVVDPTYAFLIPFVGSVVALSCGGIGLIATSQVRNINQFQTVYTFIISPMFYFSGVFFPIDDLPQTVKWAAMLSPLYHGVKLGQNILWGKDIGNTLLLHFPILVAMAVVLNLIAYRLIRPKLYS